MYATRNSWLKSIGVALGLMIVAAAVPVRAQQAAPPPQQTPPPPQQTPAPPQPDNMVFTADKMLVAFSIAESSAADFEAVMEKVKEVLAKSEKPERKQQAAHWKVLRLEAAQNGVLTYFCYIDQVVKGATYDPFKILAEGMPPDEVRKLYEKLSPGLKGINLAPLAKIIDMGGGGL
jgi:hypothetical protein